MILFASGVDGDGIPYEKKFCSETPSRGLLAIGDSATAHFALPPSYITPKGFNMSTYESIVELLFTELDWAQCSSSTGWRNTSDCPYSPLPMNSIYQRMLRQNQCMHRDYVNAGVNGQSIDNLAPDQPVVPSNYSGNLEAIPARFATEGPSTVIYALIGNVCHKKEKGNIGDGTHSESNLYAQIQPCLFSFSMIRIFVVPTMTMATLLWMSSFKRLSLSYAIWIRNFIPARM